jgi:hypothetical protein
MTHVAIDARNDADGLGGWEAIGIPTEEAQAWVHAGYRPNEAQDWRNAGALDPGTAAIWERYGFTARTAGPWMAIGEIGPADAITMSVAGMTPADCTRIRSRDPRCPDVAPDEDGCKCVENERAMDF